MESYKPYNENAVSTYKTLNICLKGMLSVIPKHRTPELTQAISECRKQIQHTLRIKYAQKPKKVIPPFISNDDSIDVMKKKQSSLLTAALLAASKENPNSNKLIDKQNLDKESKIISISFPTNSILLEKDFLLDADNKNMNNNDKNANSNNNNNSNDDNNNNKIINKLSSSNSSFSIPVEISNDSISFSKNALKSPRTKYSLPDIKELPYCKCSYHEKQNKTSSSSTAKEEHQTEILSTKDESSKLISKSKSELKFKSISDTELKSNTETNKIKKSHSFVPFFSFSSYLSSSKSSEKLDNNTLDSKNTKDKNKKEKDKKEDHLGNDQPNDHLSPKYFISIPNRKDRIEISHSLPDLVINNPTTSSSNSFTLSSLNPSSSHSIPSSSVINNSEVDLAGSSIQNKGEKPDIPKVPVMQHSLSSQDSLNFNEHLYDQSNDNSYHSHDSGDDSELEPEICSNCGGIIRKSNETPSTKTESNENDIILLSNNNKQDTQIKENENNKIDSTTKADHKTEQSEDQNIITNIEKNKTDFGNDILPANNQNVLSINHITSILSESTILTVSDANDEKFLDVVIITASQKNGLFSKLPVELIIYIFSFFRSQSDLLSLTLVNRAIGACAKTLLCGLPRLQTNDRMKKFFKIATPNNRSLLNCVRSLQLPDIKQDIIPKDFATLYPPLLTNLQHLSFYINEDKNDTLNENFWITMFKQFHQLRSVCLANRSKSVTDACIKELIKNNTFLNVLDLENIEQLTDDAFIGLSEHYQLQVLSLGNCSRITDKTLFNLSSSPDILYLSVDNCWRVTDEGLKRFAETHSLLKVFRAYGCANLTDASVSELGKYCKNLEVLDIGGTLITDIAIMSIAECCPKLVMLQIDENGDLTNKSIAIVGTSCKKLESIYLPDQITDDGVIPIAKNCKELQEITLDCLSITDNTLIALAECEELECISIRGCTDITEKGIEHLTKRCKLLYKIYVDDETNLNEKKLSKNYITRKSPQDFVSCRCSCKEYPIFIVEHEP